ncbi:hypothetical protein [Nocardioides anomalus]|nr:hypothetical protein [Nocardioides anomalus]
MTTPAPIGAVLLSTALWFAVRAAQGARRLGRPGGLAAGDTRHRR